MTNPFSRHQKLNANPNPTPENPYQTLYGLRDNPFPALALYNAGDDPRVNGEIYDAEFRAEEEKRFFDLFVKRSTGDDPVRIGFLRLAPQAGGRGNGKSIFLHRMATRLNARLADRSGRSRRPRALSARASSAPLAAVTEHASSAPAPRLRNALQRGGRGGGATPGSTGRPRNPHRLAGADPRSCRLERGRQAPQPGG